MSTSQSIAAPKDFFGTAQSKLRSQSLMNQLNSSLKQSLSGIWGYLKNIQIKNLPLMNFSKQQPSKPQTNEHSKSNSFPSTQQTKDQPQPSPSRVLSLQQHKHAHDDNSRKPLMTAQNEGSKKQRLRQKKESKRISFEEFEQKEERKINESFIKQGIENRKEINRSMVSQDNQANKSKLSIEQNNNAENILTLLNTTSNNNSKQNPDTNQIHPSIANIQPQCQFDNRTKSFPKSNLLSTKANPHPSKNPNPSHNNKTNHNNESSILNISDIDSECQFDLIGENYPENQGQQLQQDSYLEMSSIQSVEGNQKVPRLLLKEYPSPIHFDNEINGRKMKKFNNHKQTAVIKGQSQIKSNNDEDVTPHTPSKSHHKEYQFQSSNYSSKPHKPHLQIPVKRNLPLSPTANQPNMRKKLKPSELFCQQENKAIHNFTQSQSEDAKQDFERRHRYDSLIRDKYEEMTRNRLSNLGSKNRSGKEGIKKTVVLDANDTNNQASLTQQYQSFLNKNFFPMAHQHQQLLSQTKNQKSQSEAQSKPLASYIIPVDLHPKIQRKKLYTFTRQCQSKISVEEELRKSVVEDKEKQSVDEQRKVWEQEQKRLALEEEIRKKQFEEKRRKQLQEIRSRELQNIRKNNEQQAKQLQQQQQLQRQPSSQSQSQSNPNIQALPKSNSPQNSSKCSPKEQPFKQEKPTFSIFGAKVTPFSLTDSGKQKTQKETEGEKLQPVPSDIKKTSSGLQVKDNAEKPTEKVPSTTEVSFAKSPQIPTVNATPAANEEKPSIPSLPEPAKSQRKDNPFLNPTKPPKTTLLQQIIMNDTKREGFNMFSTPAPQPQQAYMSPVHNTSQYSNLDSSMCEESESNVTPNNGSQVYGNVLGNQGLNNSFLNSSFTSSNNVSPLFGQQQNSLFGGSNSLFNTGGYNTSNFNTSGFNSGGVPPVLPQSYKPTFPPAKAQNASTIIPSFMQGTPVNPVDKGVAMSLFSQRSPTKQQQSLFAPQAPVTVDKRASTTRRSKKEERIR